MTRLTIKDVAELVGVPAAQIQLWLDAKKIKASKSYQSNQAMIGTNTIYIFAEDDLEPIRRLVKAQKQAPAPDEIKQNDTSESHYTVAQLARKWQVSNETIREHFRNEDGVLKIGKAGTKYKRPYFTLRIPASVAERVRKRLSA